MNADVVIIGAGPAGIFTALEMVKKGSKQKIIMVEKGQAVENRHCPKDINNHTSFVVVCPFHASGDVFFLLVILFFTDFPLDRKSTRLNSSH